MSWVVSCGQLVRRAHLGRKSGRSFSVNELGGDHQSATSLRRAAVLVKFPVDCDLACGLQPAGAFQYSAVVAGLAFVFNRGLRW